MTCELGVKWKASWIRLCLAGRIICFSTGIAKNVFVHRYHSFPVVGIEQILFYMPMVCERAGVSISNILQLWTQGCYFNLGSGHIHSNVYDLHCHKYFFFVVVVLGVLHYFKEKVTIIVFSIWFKWLSILYFFGVNDFPFLRKTDYKKLHTSVDLNRILSSGCVGIAAGYLHKKCQEDLAGNPKMQGSKSRLLSRVGA